MAHGCSWRRWTNDFEMKKRIILVVWLVFEVHSCVVEMWICSQHVIQSSWNFWNSDMFLQKVCFFFAFLNTFDGWIMQLSRSYLPWWYCVSFRISLALSIGSSLLLGVLTRPESCSELGRRAGGWKVLLTCPPLADLGPSLHPSLQHQAARDSCRCLSQTSLFPTSLCQLLVNCKLSFSDSQRVLFCNASGIRTNHHSTTGMTWLK